MITVYPYEELGKANFGWLQANYHFSFANYYNRSRMKFGALRVINDDKVASGMGFDTHPHKNMEIITYIREGALTHYDNTGNKGTITKGQVQVMSAGTGIFHSEYNLSPDATTLYQIWIEPNQLNVNPRWASFDFPQDYTKDKLSLLVSGDGNAPLSIHQDAYIYAGNLQIGAEISHEVHNQAYLLVSKGNIEIDGKPLKKGDGAEITEISLINIKAVEDAEILIIDVPY